MTENEPNELPITLEGEPYWIVIDGQDVEEVKSTSNFGQYMQHRREALGLSQRRVASLMKEIFEIPWYQNVVTKIETGTRLIKANEALALSHIFAINLEDFLTGWDLEGNSRLRSSPDKPGDVSSRLPKKTNGDD